MSKTRRIVLIVLTLVPTSCAPKSITINVASPSIPITAPAPMPEAWAHALFIETFDYFDPHRWREVEVIGRTDYEVVTLDGDPSLKAHSRSGASILLRPIRFDPDAYDWIAWRWRIDRFVEGEDLTRKEGSDASARVYVYFDSGGLPWQKRNLDYVWSASSPVGTVLSSAYSRTSRILIVDSGTESRGSWRTVRRNLEEDYKRCFGDRPPDVIAIGVMTDTDNTGSEAIAYFDDLIVTPRRPSVESGS